MQEGWLSRTTLLLGEDKLKILKSKHVLVIGLGGVGAFAAEMIARAGVGKMTIVDGDVVNESNINRQLPALTSTIGKSKASLMKDRLLDINPQLDLDVFNEFLRQDLIEHRLSFSYDYVVDAIDTFSPKVFTIFNCLQNGHKIVSSMGAGGKVDPTQVKIARMKDSYNCKLAFKVRKRLGALKASKDFPVVFSTEPVDEKAMQPIEGELNKKTMVGTISYMPAIFGMFCASVVIRDLVGDLRL
jgi:tRNA A37 threonylcarbamoyladenosine dehydratase